MPVEGWFPTPIFFEQLQDGDELCQLVLGHVPKLEGALGTHNTQLVGDVKSGINRHDIHQYLHLVPQLRPLFGTLLGSVKRYAAALGIDLERERLFIGWAWLNVV